MADFQGKQFFQRHKSEIEKGLLAMAIVLILLVAVLFVHADASNHYDNRSDNNDNCYNDDQSNL